MKYPLHLLKLIDALKRFPGVGSKSAERFAFNLIDWPLEHREELCNLIQNIKEKLKHCPECGCLTGENSCQFCTTTRALTGVLCIISSPRDSYAVESTGEYRGLYHVLGGLLSPIDGIGPEKLNIQKLKERIIHHKIHEIVIALDSTLEGDTTALYLKQELAPLNLIISRLAFGLPMGSSLDYVDGGTLARAFAGRSSF